MKNHSISEQIIQRVEAVVTQAQINAYKKDGAVCIRQILSPVEIELLRTGIELNLKSPSPRVKIASKNDDPGRFIEDFCTWQTNPHYQQFIFESPVSLIAGKLMESKKTRLYHDHLLVKEPGTRQRTPWHQDQPYYNIEGMQNCSLWIPVDRVPHASTLEFIAGSHLGPWLMPRSFMNNQAKWFPEGSLADLPDIDSKQENYPIIGWETTPGDIVCFHMLTLHSAGGVSCNQRRRVFSVRFLGDDITHAPRKWVTSPDFPGLSEQLPAGAQMEHPLFPVIWEY
ncbi:phytanoyl-CoA dioxygenase family protein [Legionella anisa]|uniref:Phytanoyl-CoA dioxygenase n=1 Tax=Legionella anisa TaxID=28082 RepID=A0AAX0WUK9_9GAMM|nr:phytanoyl-CoA dioxygenase family protein [Legionella anisa]AWN75114.1 phytanoyl-CoA dioxygenase [Legionella anisa]KTC68476.1 Phytanoyl-CoA dioxygenase [Legionella anisa]MBN5934455.1 phytanoyl-CoA dioxygenase family protein [Legionella anisa]MCW8424677.1 phytanoyl-CoA dioxygenase family protein [Legionella anisa]MCW8446204.1 phytanoyl-CoA dioxygenase family protein [Legionella anisa]